MVTETEVESYESENDTDTGADPEEEDEGAEGEVEEKAEPVVDYKAKYEEVDKINSDKAKALSAERARRASAERRLLAMESELKALKAPKFEIPDPSEDPIGALEAMKQALIEQNKPKKADPAQEHQARVSELQAMEAEYAAENPEYNDAAQFFGQHLRAELEEQGLSGADLDTEFGAQLMKLVANAEKAGKHPGDVVMALAKKNGFNKQSIDKSVKKIDTMKAAKAATSIASAPSVGERNVSVESVLKLKPGTPERAKAFARLREEALRAERSA
jgi:hypothetical protein